MLERSFLSVIVATMCAVAGLTAQERKKPPMDLKISNVPQVINVRPQIRVEQRLWIQAANVRVAQNGMNWKVVTVGGLAPFDIAVGSTPLMHGAFHAAARKVHDARKDVEDAEEPAAALAAMDRALEALDDARAALWKQRARPVESGAEVEVAARVGQRVIQTILVESGEPAKPPAFLEGGCRKALDEFDGARKALETATELDPAFEALDRTMRALMKARRILWRATHKAGNVVRLP
jgi:hypothetical protein